MSDREQPRDPPTGRTWHAGRSDDANLVMALLVAATTTCADCCAAATVDRDGPLVNVRMTHDEGCPWFGGVTR